MIFSLAWFITDCTVPLGSFCISFFLIFSNYSLINFIIFGILWIIYYTFTSLNIARSIILLVTHFHILCYYHSLKLETENNYLNAKLNENKPITDRNMMTFMRRYNSISIQIGNHNNQFWSTYLFYVLFVYIAIIGFLLYQSLFGSASILIRLIMIYLCILNIAILSTYNLSASSIVLSQKVSYKLLNLCFIKFKTRNKAIKLKVM